MTGPAEPTETLGGVVDRILFYNPETGYTVARLAGARSGEGTIIVGRMPEVNPGTSIRATGRWKIHPVHGRQFEAANCEVVLPTTTLGIRRYLGSGMIPGIGPKLADRLVDHFGEETLEVIDQRSARLHEVEGIGPKRVRQIKEAWDRQRSIRDLMIFLEGHGLGRAHAVRIYRAYGGEAEACIRRDPFRLACDIHGIGFLTSDRVARSLGIPDDDPSRLRAGIVHALRTAEEDGHCCVPTDRLVAEGVRLLKVGEDDVRTALESVVRRGEAVRETGEPEVIALPAIWEAERMVATVLEALGRQGTALPQIHVGRALDWAQRREQLTLTDEQRQALDTALRRPVAVLTGGPGVGKTTIIRCLVAILRAKKVRLALAAPTGRAARRLGDATGGHASTLHRLLRFDPQERCFHYGPERPLPLRACIVDEASMIDVRLMASLLTALPRPCWLLLVGDADQLPSVGPGDVLRDIIRSRAVPVMRLRTVHRQRFGSAIVENAHRINRGEMPDLEDQSGEFYFVAASDPEDAREKILEIACRRIPRRFGLVPTRDVQVLAPMIRGAAGVERLNAELQTALNPEGREIQRYGRLLREGDRVMQRVNNYDREVFNGDIGWVRTVDSAHNKVTVEFDGRPVDYDTADLDELSLAYAATVHKAQGSEYPAVVLSFLRQHAILLDRNLLYTAITRAQRLAVIVGQEEAVAMALRNVRARVRWTRLTERLRDAG